MKSEKFTYDELRRLLTAQRGPDTNIQRKYQYDYDRYGNRWGQNVVAGTGYNTQLGFDTTNNRINSTGFAYDGSGNLTANNTGITFSYNQENFMLTAWTTAYQYDAQGRRVRENVNGTVTDYFYSGSVVISEKQGSSWTDYIFFGGQRIAKQTGTMASTATYIHPDHLGSTRVCTDANGNSAGTCDYEPFGEIQPGSTCGIPTNYRFGGMEWDTETGLYHTWFRQYDPSQGRWMSVDPLPGTADDPQSLNRYVYVLNDPLNLTDPLGLQHDCKFYTTTCEETEGGDVVCRTQGHFCGDSIEEPLPEDPGDDQPPVTYEECLRQFGLFLKAADFLGLWGIGSSVVDTVKKVAEQGVEHGSPFAVEKLATTTAANLENTLAPSARAAGVGIKDLPLVVDRPGPLVSLLSKARFVGIVAAQVGKASVVITAVATATSIGLRIYCKQKTKPQ